MTDDWKTDKGALVIPASLNDPRLHAGRLSLLANRICSEELSVPTGRLFLAAHAGLEVSNSTILAARPRPLGCQMRVAGVMPLSLMYNVCVGDSTGVRCGASHVRAS